MIRGYFGSIASDGTAGSWAAHDLVAQGLMLSGVIAAWKGPSWWLALVLLGGLTVIATWDGGGKWIAPWGLGGLAFVWLVGVTPFEGGLVGSLAGAGAYVWKEEHDKRVLVGRGEFTSEKRLDKVGDVLGPCARALAALTLWWAVSLGNG